jgi:hypothetical protein
MDSIGGPEAPRHRMGSALPARSRAPSLPPQIRSRTDLHLANFICICNLLRGPYKRNEYRKVILPLTVLRRFDCAARADQGQVLAEHQNHKGKPETLVRNRPRKDQPFAPFYNLSKLDLPKLLDDPNQLAPISTPTSTDSPPTSARSWNASRSISRSPAWRRRTSSTRSSKVL